MTDERPETTWREAVGKLLRDSAKARAALDAALEAEKNVRHECECGRKNNVPVKDHANAVRAAEIWFRQGAELAKHLERLRDQAPVEDDRPLRDLTTKELLERARKAGLSLPARRD